MNLTQQYLDKVAAAPITGAAKHLQKSIKASLSKYKFVLVKLPQVEDGKAHKARTIVQRIESFMIGGQVKTTTGDLYKVKPIKGNLDRQEYQYEAIA